MEYKFRMQSIHAEVDLLAGELDKAPDNKKNEAAERLRWLVQNYPNAELWRALPVVRKYMLGGRLNSVSTQCAVMMGEIGAETKGMSPEKIREAASALAEGLKSNDIRMQELCVKQIGRIAEARKGYNLDCVIEPLLRIINDEVSEGIDGMDPALVEIALAALGEITPTKRESLDLLGKARGKMIGQKMIELDETTRREEREQIREAWNPYVSLISRVEKKWAGVLKIAMVADDAKSMALPNGNGGMAQGSRGGRRIVRIVP